MRGEANFWHARGIKFAVSLVLMTVVACGLFGYHALRYHSLSYDYLLWNLFLAWLPLLFATALIWFLRCHLWSSWRALGLTLLWLIFLPNSFYLVSDFIHLQTVASFNVVYDVVMFAAFVFAGLIIGLTALWLVHAELLKRLRPVSANLIVAFVILLVSFAIYLGRDLRWNSWDVFLSPGGLLFDVSERFVHPASFPDMFETVIGFFVLISTVYLTVFAAIESFKTPKNFVSLERKLSERKPEKVNSFIDRIG